MPQNPSEVQASVDWCRKAGRFGLDLETQGLDPRQGGIRSIALSAKIDRKRKTWCHTFEGPDALPFLQTLDCLRPLLEDERLIHVNHNAVFDSGKWLPYYGIKVRNKSRCTRVQAWVLDEGRAGTGRLALQHLAMEKLDKTLLSVGDYDGGGSLPFDQRQLADKGGPDAEACDELYEFQDDEMQDEGLRNAYEKVECPVSAVTAKLEENGFAVDVGWYRNLNRQFGQRLIEIENELRRIAGHRINVGSTEQVSWLLFGKLGLKPKEFMREKPDVYRMKKSGPDGEALWSTKEEVISEYAVESPAVDLITQHRHIVKLKGTYNDFLIDESLRSPDGRVRVQFDQCGTATGRYSSRAHQMPRDGGSIRNGIVAGPGNVLVAVDWSQIELRFMAHLSKDAEMVRAYREGLDIHQMTMDALGIAERPAAKGVNFGLIYGMSPWRFVKQMWLESRIRVDIHDAERWIDKWFQKYRGVRPYWDRCEAQIKSTGMIRTMCGRKRSLDRDYKFDRSMAIREGVNTTVQGSVADMCKIAMIRLDRELEERSGSRYWRRVKLVLQVHDELVCEAPEIISEDVLDLMVSVMVGAAKLCVPVVASGGIGRSLEDAKKDAKKREDAA